jgi:ABC-type multidrug transport system fused ATPase/permease subunit
LHTTERWAIALPAMLCLLLFFFPVVTTTFPIVGTRSQSGYDVVFSDELHDISENVKATSKTGLPFSHDGDSTPSPSLPVSVRFVNWIPVFVAAMFIASAVAALGAFLSGAAVQLGCVVGIVSSIALVVYFKVLNSDMHRFMDRQIHDLGAGANDDLFAGIAQGIGKLFSTSFEIAPAAGLYVIASALAVSLFLVKSRVLARIIVASDEASGTP